VNGYITSFQIIVHIDKHTHTSTLLLVYADNINVSMPGLGRSCI
jgi:hypothetical protein